LEVIGDVLLPAVEHYEAMQLRSGRVFRGKLRDEARRTMGVLAGKLAQFPGTFFFENVDGDDYVVYQYYEGLPPVRWKLHATLLALTVLTTMIAHSEESLTGFYWHVTWAVHEVQMAALQLVGVLVTADGGVASRLAAAWAHVVDILPLLHGGVLFSVAVLAILLAHEGGHYFAARSYGMTVTPPFFLPAPLGVGTLGAIIRIRTPMIHKRMLLAVGGAGPIAGLIVSIAVLAAGTALSEFRPVSSVVADSLRGRLGDSILSSVVRWLIVGPTPAGHILSVHPLRLAGWFGLVITALNLLPIGQLDGGHIAYALFGPGQRAFGRGAKLGILVLGLLGALATFGPVRWPVVAVFPQVWLMWLLVALLLQVAMRGAHPPLIFEGVPLGRARTLVAVLLIVAFVITFVPSPFDLRVALAAG
jgi:hypothetical protein